MVHFLSFRYLDLFSVNHVKIGKVIKDKAKDRGGCGKALGAELGLCGSQGALEGPSLCHALGTRLRVEKASKTERELAHQGLTGARGHCTVLFQNTLLPVRRTAKSTGTETSDVLGEDLSAQGGTGEHA